MPPTSGEHAEAKGEDKALLPPSDKGEDEGLLVSMNSSPVNKTLHVDKALVEAAVVECFSRYDVDDSGTLNTIEEARMLTINLVFKLDIEPVDVNAKIAELGTLDDSCAMDATQYSAWFFSTFVAD